jgi:thiosulfate reductase cytochrome b subunit
MHWVNALAVVALLMSGLQIFNAHPALYWGKSSYTGSGPAFQMFARRDADGRLEGVTQIGSLEFGTTGVFGASRNTNGELVARGFPKWATLPSDRWLAMARRWHFFFAWIFVVNGALYVAHGFITGRFRELLLPTRRDWRSFGRTVKDHLLLRHARGEEARRYNVLQKLAYLGLMYVVMPALLLMGLAMSPWFDTVLSGWVDLVGGRQSARTLHFIAAMLLVAFTLVHLFEVLVTGVWNNVRSMITGNYRIDTEPPVIEPHGDPP